MRAEIAMHSRSVARKEDNDQFAVKSGQVKIWLKMLDKRNGNSILSEMKGSIFVVLSHFGLFRFMSKRSISLVSVIES